MPLEMYENTLRDLKDIIGLLDGEKSHWADFFRKALSDFKRQEYRRCAETIVSGSGGMGSLNDLVLGQTTDQNGRFQWKEGHREINDSYQRLLERLYLFAYGMRRSTK